MKTLFFIAALAAAVFLVMQTPAGKAWLETSEPELELPLDIQQQVSLEDVRTVENKVTEIIQHHNQKQQAQIDQLESRIAELENELIMSRIAEKQQQSVASGVVTLHPYKQQDEQVITLPPEQDFALDTQAAETLAATSHNQMRRNRQAKLQDIAQKMEMSSLQALVN